MALGHNSQCTCSDCVAEQRNGGGGGGGALEINDPDLTRIKEEASQEEARKRRDAPPFADEQRERDDSGSALVEPGSDVAEEPDDRTPARERIYALIDKAFPEGIPDSTIDLFERIASGDSTTPPVHGDRIAMYAPEDVEEESEARITADLERAERLVTMWDEDARKLRDRLHRVKNNLCVTCGKAR